MSIKHMGINLTGDFVIVVVALHPSGGIDGDDGRLGTFGERGGHVVRLAEDDMLAVALPADGTAIRYLRPSRHRQRRRSDCNTLQLSKEIAGMGRLVVAAHLPYHCLTVLVVVPKRVITPRGIVGGGVDSECTVISSPENELFTPVAQDIALG